jgi:hypothetical protein
MIRLDQKGTVMSNQLMKTTSAAVDGFGGYEDGIEGHERPANAGLMQGTVVKFTNEAAWVNREEDEIDDNLELIAADVQRVVQFWKDGHPTETRILEAGEKFPDLEALNAEVPQSEWVEGPDGKLRGPWQAQHILYLLDPLTMDKYTFPTGTVGGRIAITELRDKIVWMQKTRGPNIYAVVTLADKHMNTRFGGRQRPHFNIVKWTRLGGEGGEEIAALPSPSSAPAVQEPSLAEEMNDSVDELFVEPEKKPAKAKRSSKEAA